jgi:hypothetical protein
MTKTIEWKKTQPGSTEAVQFSDGMLVTAEDLTAAMRYPLSVVQVLLKAYFGCGIVCGLGLRDPAAGPAGETKDVRSPGTAHPEPVQSDKDRNFILMVDKGVALGCDGYPIEICGPLKLDLTPDPCDPDEGEKELFIAVRRVTAAEAAARACGCGSTGGEPAQQCTRMRDHALVQAFAKLPAGICEIPPPAKDGEDGAKAGQASVERPTGVAGICACLKQCGECACTGEPWVLLGSVRVGKEQGLRMIDESRRRYVKPLACVCDAVESSQPKPAPKVEPSREEETDSPGETPAK